MLQNNAALLALVFLCVASSGTGGVVRGEEYNLDWVAQFGVQDKSMTIPAGENSNVVFSWEGYHDVMQLSDADAFDLCNFQGSTKMRGPSNGGTAVITAGTANTTEYFACSVGRHCSFGQKVAITWV